MKLGIAGGGRTGGDDELALLFGELEVCVLRREDDLDLCGGHCGRVENGVELQVQQRFFFEMPR